MGTDIGTTIRRRYLWNTRAAVRAYALARSIAGRVGLQLVLKTYYSPIPDIDQVPTNSWSDADPMRGIRFSLDEQLAFVRDELGPRLAEFTDQPFIDSAYAYQPDNPSYPPPDARLLFAMVRYFRPRTVVELGSGHTSRVIADACLKNASEGHHARFCAFDPSPTVIDLSLTGLSELVRVPAQEVPEEVFASLRSGDLLVVDTTHTVKLGSEVNRIVLQLLPLLAPGVVVHFHDIYLPYEYPRYLAHDYGLYWAEQYLLQAFLAMNPGYEVLCAVHALARDSHDAAVAAGLLQRGEGGGALWIRRTGQPV